MSEDDLLNLMKTEFGAKIQEASSPRPKRVIINIDRKDILDICKYLKEKDFDYLSCISGVDFEDRYESVYHIWNNDSKILVQINAVIPRDDVKIDSVHSIWKAADWLEREAYDMLGIEYVGHPDLRRILLPDDYDGYPLKKDFKLEAGGWFQDG